MNEESELMAARDFAEFRRAIVLIFKRKRFKSMLYVSAALSMFYWIVFIAWPNHDRAVKHEFSRFNEAEIKGHITFISKGQEPYHSECIRVSPDAIFFYPTLYIYGIEGYRQFRKIAGVGDSIVKRSHSDTLMLIKGERIYYCYFDKYRD